MAIAPAAISANPATTMTFGELIVPASPAASANGTVSPSDMPMTMSRTVAVAVKCVSMCRVAGMRRNGAHSAQIWSAAASIAAALGRDGRGR
jgi:hypothetical protein